MANGIFCNGMAAEPEGQRTASHHGVKQNLYWIWFVGAAAWFFDAALSLHYGSPIEGLLEVLIAAAFLAMGMYLKKQGSHGR